MSPSWIVCGTIRGRAEDARVRARVAESWYRRDGVRGRYFALPRTLDEHIWVVTIVVQDLIAAGLRISPSTAFIAP